MRAVFAGTGMYVPSNVVDNDRLSKLMDTNDEWIQKRTGIQRRRYADLDQASSDLALAAAEAALADAGIGKADIDYIVFATMTPDHYFPGIGVLVQAKLGLTEIGALDVRNQCSGFLYALSIASSYIQTGMYKKILLVAAEVQSSNLDYSDEGRDLAVLFGDGAAAVILEPNELDDGRGVLSTHLFADGRFATELWMDSPSPKDHPTFYPGFIEDKRHFPKMNGKTVFKNASEKMPKAVQIALKHNGLTIENVDHLIPHQANDRISQMVAKILHIPIEKVIRNIDRFGNTTAASIPIGLNEAVKNGRIQQGDIVVLTAFGSGFTWGSSVIRW